MEADLDAIKAKGYQVISPLVICNSSEMEEINMTALGKDVVPGTAVVTIKK